jgi:hypothetical protein
VSPSIGASVKNGLKRIRGDSALKRSERSLLRELQALRRSLRTDLEAISARIDAALPPTAPPPPKEAGPFASASQSTRDLFADPRPWMVSGAVDLVEQHLRPDMTILEYGGGASTPYWCERAGVLHTVEASPGWAMILLDYMCHRFDLIDRWRFHFVGANWANVDSGKRRTGRSLPEPEVRRRMEDDYAIVLSDHVDAIIIDGSVRQRTAERLTTYIERDQPEIVLVDNMDATYVSESVDRVDFSGYERHDFWGEAVDKEGQPTPDCTTVWLRKKPADSETTATDPSERSIPSGAP